MTKMVGDLQVLQSQKSAARQALAGALGRNWGVANRRLSSGEIGSMPPNAKASDYPNNHSRSL